MNPTTKAHRFEALRTFAAELTVPPRPKRAVSLSSHQRAAIQEFLDAALAENTRKAYAYYWRQFATWCQMQGYSALPAEPVLVAAFLAELAAPPDGTKGASVSTITIAVSAIRYVHAKAAPDTPNPASAPSVRTVMAGIRRKLRDRKPSRKHPMTRDRLERLLSTLPDDTVSGARDRALILLSFALALRSSEAVSLNVSHVTIDRTGATISLSLLQRPTRLAKVRRTGSSVAPGAMRCAWWRRWSDGSSTSRKWTAGDEPATRCCPRARPQGIRTSHSSEL